MCHCGKQFEGVHIVMFVFSKFYEPSAILADAVNGPLVANLLGMLQ